VLTGVAALVAGAFSMGTGEYISVTNQNELVHAEVTLERGMHARFSAAEQAELADTFRGYGADPDTAAKMAAARVARSEHRGAGAYSRGARHRPVPLALRHPGGYLVSGRIFPWALAPLLPYLFGLPVLAATLGITAVALLVDGMVVGRLTGRSLLRSGLRQLALGGVAVAVTFAVGSLVGGHVS
jgi:VIT1/CCC1 family predicted Fe2+/Mn2+ transporter